MQKRFLILAITILGGLSDLSAQVNAKRKVNEYGHEIKMNAPNKFDMVDNEIIVKFKEGVLSNDFLESKDMKRNVSSEKKSTNNKTNISNSFFANYNGNLSTLQLDMI